MKDILLIIVVVLCSIIALGRPVIGMLTFIWLGFFNPHSMTWGIGRTIPLSQLAGIGTIFGYLFWSEPKRFPWHRESILLLGLWSVFGISTFYAFNPEKAFEFLDYISKILLMALLSTSLINSEHRLNLLILVISLSLGFYGLKGGIFVLITGGNYIVWGPDRSFLEANNAIGMALTMNIPLLIYLFKRETHQWLRWIMGAMLVFSYPAIICTYSRGAWISLAITTALIIFKSKYKFSLALAAAAFVVIALPFLSQRVPQRLLDRYDALANYEEEESAQSRFWSWELCKRAGLARPFTGNGFNFYSIEAQALYFPEFLERWPGKVWSCHSMWYSIFAEHGFPGLIVWLLLLVSCLASLRQLRSQGRAYASMSQLVHCAGMVQIALISYMVVGTFLDVVYFDMFYYLTAITIIIKERMRVLSLEISSPRATISISRALIPKHLSHF